MPRLLSTQSSPVVGSTRIKSLVNKTSYLELTISELAAGGEKTLRLNPHWLRFNCSLCILKDSGQRLTLGEQIPEDLTIKSVKLTGENVFIEWNDSSNQPTSKLSLSFLINHYPEVGGNENRYKPCLDVTYFDYSKFYKSNGEKNYPELLKYFQNTVRFFRRYQTVK